MSCIILKNSYIVLLLNFSYGLLDFNTLHDFAGQFPTLVIHQESHESKVNETKVVCLGVALGNVSIEEKQIIPNVQSSVNFLISLLKRN